MRPKATLRRHAAVASREANNKRCVSNHPQPVDRVHSSCWKRHWRRVARVETSADLGSVRVGANGQRSACRDSLRSIPRFSRQRPCSHRGVNKSRTEVRPTLLYRGPMAEAHRIRGGATVASDLHSPRRDGSETAKAHKTGTVIGRHNDHGIPPRSNPRRSQGQFAAGCGTRYRGVAF
jgi:hypothetical protein